MEGDHVEIALLKMKLERDETEIADLKKRVASIERSVLTGQIGAVMLIGFGTLIGWFVSTGDKIRSWFH